LPGLIFVRFCGRSPMFNVGFCSAAVGVTIT
jgi:hypothetical protein